MSEAMEIGPVVITAYKEQTYGAGPISGGGYGDDFGNSAIGKKIIANARKEVSEKFRGSIITTAETQEKEYAKKRQSIPSDVQKKTEDDKKLRNIKPEDEVANIWSEMRSLENIISQTSLDVVSLQAVANSFYRRNFFDQPVTTFIREAAARLTYGVSIPEDSYKDWLKSLYAAYEVKRLNDLADFATRKKANVDAQAKEAMIATNNIEDPIKFTAAFSKEVAGKFGDKALIVASELAESAKGSKIRSADEAFKAFDKYKDALNKKFSASDRAAAAKYIDSMDFEAISKAAAKFSKGFGLIGPAFDFKDAYTEYKNSQKSNDWKPFFVKVESIALGVAATALISAMFGFIAVTPLGILTFAFLMAITGALITDANVDKINNFIAEL